MNAETETAIRFLDGADLIAGHVIRPDNRDDAADVLASVHQLLGTTGALHDQIAECLGLIDHRGRCEDCGRLVAQAHKKRGCAFAVPLWFATHLMSVPYLGKAIWWVNRRLRNAEALTKSSSVGGVQTPPRPPTPSAGEPAEPAR